MTNSGAATLTWTGAAGDNNINTAGNWDPAQTPTAGDDLVFAGSTSLTPQENSNLSPGSLAFGTTASAFTLGGAGVYTVGVGGIINNSAATGTINNAITLGAAQTWMASNGALNFGGTIANAGFLLTVDGAFNTTISNSISGSGGLTKNGTGILTLSGANAYTGATTINAGTVTLDYTTVGSKLEDTSILALAGGTLNLANGASAHNEVVASTTINSGASRVTRTSGTSVLRMNVITHTSGGTINFGAANLADTDTSNTNGILGGWATVGGADWAVSSTSAADTAITALASYSAFGTSSTTTNQIITSNGTTNVGNHSTYSLKIAPTGVGGTLIIGPGHKQLQIVSGGLLFVGSNDYTIVATNPVGTLAGANNGELIVQQFSTGNLTISATIVDNGTTGLIKAGTGTLILSGANTYTGVTTINEGTLSVGAIGDGGVAGNLGQADIAATNLVFNGGTLQYTGATAGTNRNFTINTGKTAIIDITANNLTLSGVSTATTGALTKIGAGVLTLTGANTYTGLTDVQAGTLSLGRVDGTLADSAAVQVSGGTLDVANSDTVGAVTLSSGSISGAGTLTGTSYSLTNTGMISAMLAGPGSMTKTGAGTVTLTGVNTFGGAGQTVGINGGSLQVGSDNNLGNTANSLTFDGGTLLFSAGFSTSRNVTLNAGGGTIATANNAVTFATPGVISGVGALTKIGTGTLTLTGTNTYQGGTVLNAGTLSITSDGNLGTGNLQINNGATLVTNGSFDFTHGFVLSAPSGPVQADGLAVSGIINVQSGTLSMITNGITDGGTGGRLMKIGGGTLDLQVASPAFGGNTEFSGGIYIHEGTLLVTAIGSLGINPVTTFDNGATLIVNVNVGGMGSVGQFKVGTGGAFVGETAGKTSFSNGVISNVSGQAGGITFIGPGKTGMGGNNTFVGTVGIGNPATPLVPAILSISRDVNLGAASNQLTIGNGSTLMIEDGIDATQPVGSAAIAATFSTSRQINLAGSTATIEVKNTGDAINYSPVFSPGGLNTLAPHVNVLTVNGVIAGSAELIKAGEGTLVLTNTGNNYAGGTTINGGILSISDPAALGAASSLITINPTGIFQATGSFSSARMVTLGGTGGAGSGGTFEVTGANNETRTGVISGSGSLTKTGTGTLTLTAVNTFSGLTVVNAGELDLDTTAGQSIVGDLTVSGGTAKLLQGSQINSGKNLVVSGGIFDVQGFNQSVANVQLISGSIIGSGGTLTSANDYDMQSGSVSANLGGGIALTKTAAGTVTLSGENTYTGGTNINAGVLSLDDSGALGSTGTISFGGGTLQYSAGNTIDYSSRFSTSSNQAYNIDTNGQDVIFSGAVTSSGGTFTKSGAGNLTMTSVSNTYAGATTVDDGTLQIDGVIASAVMVNSGATLSGTGSVSKAVTISGVGALRPGIKTPTGSGLGTFTLSGSGADGDLTVASTAELGLQLGANGIAFANQATTYYTSPGVLNTAYVNAANLQANANDRIVVGGTLTLTSGSIIEVTLSNYIPSLGDAFDVLDWTTLAQGSFTIGPNIRTGADNALYDLSLPDITAVNSDYNWDVSLLASDGIIVVVPEPSRAILLMAGLMAILLRRHRKHGLPLVYLD